MECELAKAKLQANYDFLLDAFNDAEADDLSIDNVNAELHDTWRDYIEAGFSISKIVKMMSPVDVWVNFLELRELGSRVKLASVFGKLMAGGYWISISLKDIVIRNDCDGSDVIIDRESLVERGASDNLLKTYESWLL